MVRKRHKPEEIVAKLRQVDVLVSQGRSVAEAIRSIGVTEVAATCMAALGVMPHVVEAILNHASGHQAGVAGIYNRANYADESARLSICGRTTSLRRLRRTNTTGPSGVPEWIASVPANGLRPR